MKLSISHEHGAPVFRRMFLMFMALCVALSLGSSADGADGNIVFDETNRVIHVIGFGEEEPATLRAVHAADQAAGWGVISPLPGAPGFEVNASLWIGDDCGSSTYFQLGGAQHPNEKLLIAGDVWVRPGYQRPGPAAQRPVNRLTSGSPDTPDSRSIIAIRCSRPQEYGLVVGKPQKPLAQMFLYRTHLKPVDQPLRGGMSGHGPGGWSGSRFEIVDCRLSGIASRAVYGPGYRNAVLRDITIEDCEWAFSLGDRVAERIVFRNNELALDRAIGTYIDCRLEGNERDIVWHSRGTIFWVDTGDGLAGAPPDRDLAVNTEMETLPEERPVLTEFRRIIFEIVSADGEPISGTHIRLTPYPADPEAVQAVPPVVTDMEGRTPEDLYMDAILLARARWYRTEENGEIQRVPYRYRIDVEDPSGRTSSFELDDEDLGRPGPWRFTWPSGTSK